MPFRQVEGDGNRGRTIGTRHGVPAHRNVIHRRRARGRFFGGRGPCNDELAHRKFGRRQEIHGRGRLSLEFRGCRCARHLIHGRAQQALCRVRQGKFLASKNHQRFGAPCHRPDILERNEGHIDGLGHVGPFGGKYWPGAEAARS